MSLARVRARLAVAPRRRCRRTTAFFGGVGARAAGASRVLRSLKAAQRATTKGPSPCSYEMCLSSPVLLSRSKARGRTPCVCVACSMRPGVLAILSGGGDPKENLLQPASSILQGNPVIESTPLYAPGGWVSSTTNIRKSHASSSSTCATLSSRVREARRAFLMFSVFLATSAGADSASLARLSL